MIRLRVFGSLELCSDGGDELRTVLAQPKRAALLAYLAAASPGGFHHRDRLLALFWPELDDAHARDALNTAVRFLRREVGRAAIANRGSDEIGIDGAVCWSDVAAFRAALDDGRHEEALSLYRGDLLDGFFTDGAGPFEEWLERMRVQLRAGAARAARVLAEQREREENFTIAVSFARRAVELSDGNERVLRQLLEMLERLGDRAGAILAYEAFERRLATELETEPAAETRALIARIRSRESVVTAPSPLHSGPSIEPSSAGLRGWRVERELGRGGMATVYLARDTAHDRFVALKVMRPELVLSAGVEHFLREIQITARLAHPHIVPLIDSGAREGVPYLVTPYVDGESLRARLVRERTLPLSDALRIATEIAEALDYAHRSGVVHRDVKPENVLLADGHAVVADFGLARALAVSGASPLARSTEDGTIVGSPRYMSPEQAMGSGDVDARTDLYSLGCILFEMLAGEAPNGGGAADARLARQPDVPADLRVIVSDCLAPERERRPPSAAQLLRRLEELKIRIVRHTVPEEGHPQLAQQKPFWWRRPWVLGAATLVLAGAGLGVWKLTSGGSSVPAVGGLDPKRVAVLYFEDLSRDSSLAFVADGLTEALIGTLSQVQFLRVVSKGGVEAFRSTDASHDSIARAVQAGTLIRGTIEPVGTMLSLNVQLMNDRGSVLNSAGFELPSDNLLAVRDSLAQEVARLVRTKLGSEIRLQQQRKGTSDVAAWSLLQQAEQLRKSAEAAASRNDTLARNRGFSAADSLLALAEARDPKWGDPVIARGLVAYRRSRLYGRDRTVMHPWIREGLDHVERALALDAKQPDALELRGNLRYWGWLQGLEPDAEKARVLLADAQKDLESATESNPAQAGAWASLSHLYNQTASRTKVAIAAQRAVEADAFLDNAVQILFRLFLAHYDLGQFSDADHWCAEIGRRYPGDYSAPRCELFMQTTRARATPDVALAWRLADSVTRTAPAVRRRFFELNAHMLVAAVLARAGQKDSATRVVERSKGDSEMNPTRDLALFGAFVYAQLGEPGKAVDLLGVYLQANEGQRAEYADDPGWWFRRITNDPAFKRLVGTP